jgi:alkylation response protein AidB-like acyl-CoA dehydrogenase
LVAEAATAGEDVEAGLRLAERYGVRLPQPGGGDTALRWQLLADVAAQDLTAARILEAHSDALAILAEAGESDAPGRWGVFAAESPGVALRAVEANGHWTVDGTKPWCSLAGVLDRALVTAQVETGRQLFQVDLRLGSVSAEPPSGWVARGLRRVPSGPVHFASTPARPVGGPGWYLTRPGFAWGGIGVAACWYGGARALADRLNSVAAKRGGDLMHLAVGRVDVALLAARLALADAARTVDAGQAEGSAGEVLALRVRSVVAAAAEQTLALVGRALGPAPLAFDETYARRTADLELYIRQHHAERDLAALGGALVTAGTDDR